MRLRIPAELRKLAQWVCCRPDKIPLDPRTGRRASVTDPATWGTFDEAMATQLWTGYVLSDGDPYTVIDLDDKGNLSREQQDVHARILSAFADTYVERSINGRGHHIWCGGKIPEAIKRDSVEIYSRDRYMICTGDVANDRPIVDKQSLLSQLAGEMRPRPSSAFTDQAASLSDDEIWRMAATAANSNKFVGLCEGDWHAMGYPSQSEADMALLSIFAFYSKSNEQCRRMFRQTALGQRPKAAKRDDYLERSLRAVRASEVAPVDLSVLNSPLNARQSKGPLNSAHVRRANSRSQQVGPDGPASQPSEPITQCLDGVKPEKVTWIWTGRLAVGKITVLDGTPGSGKSTITCDSAARVSRGLAFPHDGLPRNRGGVIFVAGEDGVADTVVPRLRAADADLSRCYVWPANKLPYLPDAANDIAREVKVREAKLLVLDPVTALFARDLSTNSDQDVRLALTPLAVAAEELGCCVLLLRHLNKRAGASAFDRGGGSVGIGALARVVLLVARDHSDPDLRILATVKANLTRPPRSLQARIEDVGGVGRVAWGDECDTTADSLVTESPHERQGKTGSAAGWLRQTLSDGQWHRQKEIEVGAQAVGIAERTLRRAREDVGVNCKQMNNAWWWNLSVPDGQTSGLEGLASK